MSDNRSHGSHVGSASILLIFTVLSIISFATLTLVNSKADYNLSDNLSERQKTYYQACHKGNAFVAAVNSGYEIGAEDGIMKESIPLTDNQSLDIEILVNSANNSANSDNTDNIIKWRIINHSDFSYDTALPVFK
ncbi:MAG: hypothetical protein IJU77_08325 [Butyrivibrio sp.]|nr:hypothetical protein [Butyrivibrio sp.]